MIRCFRQSAHVASGKRSANGNRIWRHKPVRGQAAVLGQQPRPTNSGRALNKLAASMAPLEPATDHNYAVGAVNQLVGTPGARSAIPSRPSPPWGANRMWGL